jgi:hypothetical protein
MMRTSLFLMPMLTQSISVPEAARHPGHGIHAGRAWSRQAEQ